MKSRRHFVRDLGIGAGAVSLAPLAGAAAAARVVIVGGGFAGASCARALREFAPAIQVTLVEPKKTYTACPFSNLVIAGQRGLAQQEFDYRGVVRSGVEVLHRSAVDIDPVGRRVRLDDGAELAYDRLVVAPGIEIRWGALEGYDEAAAERMPHAWQAGAQTLLLRRQLEAMPDGGLAVIAAPAAPYRCPPGPYERASLIAAYLKRAKPRSKLLILDAKDSFSKKPLFMQGWKQLYGDLIEWQGASDGAAPAAVDAGGMRLLTDFDEFRPDVANVIPPQRAGFIARRADLSDASGWCPIVARSFESTRQPGIHVIGDAAIANAMPKSAFAANAQGKLCAVQVARLLAGEEPVDTTLLNTCYSYVDTDYAISVAGVYRPQGDSWRSLDGAGGTSPLDADADARRREADYAADWFDTITGQVFG
ncbi:MAG: NAD(P)/FAD-dependent oxidoreductase [Halieaceae bacterium]|nr:NAD(P)/FAD-dependent oxidoreductase [Halieaceae bacterium]